MKVLYRIYQFCVVLPIGLLMTLLTAIVTIVGCFVGNDHVWGYYPGKVWSWALIRMLLLPVRIVGKENMEKGKSYVICANHQGAFDIFLIYGFLGCNFKWVMKQSLRKIPFVGKACEAAGFIFIDTNGASHIRESLTKAVDVLKHGTSIVVFPEGRRSETGQMGPYKRGAFIVADELKMPVLPVTINGSFKVLPRQRGFNFVDWHPLELVIHKPICPDDNNPDNCKFMMEKSREATLSALR